MAYSISRRDLSYPMGAWRRGISYAHSADKSKTLTKRATETLAVAGAAFVTGAVVGYHGESEVFGFPSELIAGTALNLLELWRGGKTWGDLGTGVYAAYATRKGAQVGDAFRRKGGHKIAHPGFPAASGMNSFVGGERRPMSEPELAAFAVSSRS
jgi:hypothetical protein